MVGQTKGFDKIKRKRISILYTSSFLRRLPNVSLSSELIGLKSGDYLEYAERGCNKKPRHGNEKNLGISLFLESIHASSRKYGMLHGPPVWSTLKTVLLTKEETSGRNFFH